MRLTYKGDYALKTIFYLAIHYKENLITINELAKQLDIPIKFLEQILLGLKRGGFVESRRGKEGGYLLAKSPSRIRIGDVVRFIDGPIEPIGCIEKGYSGCNDINGCVFRNIWKKVAKKTSEVVDSVTFADLVKQLKSKEKAVDYQI